MTRASLADVEAALGNMARKEIDTRQFEAMFRSIAAIQEPHAALGYRNGSVRQKQDQAATDVFAVHAITKPRPMCWVQC
jgi:hypothetical protein